jgi:hypothetical protein
MCHIVIIDSNKDRNNQIIKEFQEALPEIKIYRCFYNRDREVPKHEYHYYDSSSIDIDPFKPCRNLPQEQAIIALWHYRDAQYEPTYLPKVIVKFGGGGEENDPNFYHMSSQLNLDNIQNVLLHEKVRELWKWACNPSDKRLPRLIRSHDPALMALQMICGLYLKLYKDIKFPIERNTLESIKSLWLSTFQTVENLQSYFTQSTESPNNPIAEIINAIQQIEKTLKVESDKSDSWVTTDLWTSTDLEKLEQICSQCLNIPLP